MSVNCEQFDKQAVDLLYDELDELSASAALRHLHHCSRCLSIYDKLKITKEQFDAPVQQAEPELLAKVIALEQRARASLPWTERIGRAVSVLAEYAMRPQSAMAAVLLLMVATSFIFVREEEDSSKPQPAVSHEQRSEAPNTSTKNAIIAKVYPSEEMTNQERKNRVNVLVNEAESLGLKQRLPNYREAMTAFQAGRYATAEQLFRQVALAGGDKSASAALQEAHSARNGSGCDRAAPLYRAVFHKYSGSTVELEARWHSASCYRALGKNALAAVQLRVLSKNAAYRARAEKALAAVAAITTPALSGSSDSAEKSPSENSNPKSEETSE